MVQVLTGTRVGFWNPGPHFVPDDQKFLRAFTPKGVWVGPPMGDHIIGTRLNQELMEGTLQMQVGVLFRPDRNKYQRLETILILHNWIPEMFDYSDWEATG